MDQNLSNDRPIPTDPPNAPQEELGDQKDTAAILADKMCRLPSLAQLKTLPPGALEETLQTLPPERRGAFVDRIIKEIQVEHNAALETWFSGATHEAIDKAVAKAVSTADKQPSTASEKEARVIGDLVDRISPKLAQIADKVNQVDRPSLEYVEAAILLAKKHNVCLSIADVDICPREEPPAPRSRSKKAE